MGNATQGQFNNTMSSEKLSGNFSRASKPVGNCLQSKEWTLTIKFDI